jgi:Domain of unknown function (DUF4340)
MNRKQFIILLVFVVIIGAAGLVLRHRQNAAWESPSATLGEKLMPKFPVNDVAAIAIRQGTNELDLVKKDDLWRVKQRDDYPANYSDIRSFLLKAKDLKIIQSETVGPSQLPRLSLVPGTGTNAAMVVDFKDDQGKTLQTLLLGKQHMHAATGASPYGMGGEGWADGRYVKVGNNSDLVALISETLSNIQPKPADWLNKDFFKIQKVHSIEVDYPTHPTNSWKLTRTAETSEWNLANAKPGEKLDVTKAASVTSPLSSPYFNDVATQDAKAKDFGMDTPTVVKVATFDNFDYTLKIGKKRDDTYPLAMTVSANIPKERTPGKDEKKADKAKLDKEFKDNQKKLEDKLAQESKYQNWTYLVSSWSWDSLLKNRSQLLQTNKTAKVSNTTAKTTPKPSPEVSLMKHAAQVVASTPVLVTNSSPPTAAGPVAPKESASAKNLANDVSSFLDPNKAVAPAPAKAPAPSSAPAAAKKN